MTKKATRTASALAFALMLTALPLSAYSQGSSDQEIKKQIIQQSIRDYPGSCACPYQRASNGSRCGKRSAYSKPGGHSPVCYEADVTDAMVRSWKAGGR